jgi:hypothetical protein
MLLQINIPTYKRQDYLEKNLKILNHEINEHGLRSVISVFVYDNNESAELSVFNKVLAEGFGFVYIGNGCNIGSDRNIYRCYSESNSDYTWVLGDDDFILPNELLYIVNLISEAKCDLLIIRPSGFDFDYIEEVPNLNRENTITSDPLKYLNEIGGLCTFISSIIVRSDFGKSLNKDILIGSNLIQVGVFINALIHGTCFARTSHYSISCKRNNSSGYISENVFVYKLIKLLKEIDCSLGLRKILIKSLIIRFYPQMFLVRRMRENFSNYKIKKIKKLLSNESFYYYLFVHPIIKFPRSIAIPYGFIISLISRLICGDSHRVYYFIRAKYMRFLENIRGG